MIEVGGREEDGGRVKRREEEGEEGRMRREEREGREEDHPARPAPWV